MAPNDPIGPIESIILDKCILVFLMLAAEDTQPETAANKADSFKNSYAIFEFFEYEEFDSSLPGRWMMMRTPKNQLVSRNNTSKFNFLSSR